MFDFRLHQSPASAVIHVVPLQQHHTICILYDGDFNGQWLLDTAHRSCSPDLIETFSSSKLSFAQSLPWSQQRERGSLDCILRYNIQFFGTLRCTDFWNLGMLITRNCIYVVKGKNVWTSIYDLFVPQSLLQYVSGINQIPFSSSSSEPEFLSSRPSLLK